MPRVSVIIPTYNRREYLQQAIESVLAQSYTDFELIVIDDGSTDGTDEMIRQTFGEKVRYIWQSNRGESHARNHGIREAQGEYIAFLDSDDIWLPGKLTRQVLILDADPGLGLVYGQSLHIDSKGKLLTQKPYNADVQPGQITVEMMLVRNVMTGICTNGLFRREALQAIGGFDHRIQYGEDWDLGIRLLSQSKVMFLPEPLSCNRDHPGKQSIIDDQQRTNQRLKDVLFCLDHYKEIFPQPEIQTLIRRQRCHQMVRAALMHLVSNNGEGAENLLQNASAEDGEDFRDGKLWQEELIGCAWIILPKQKSLASLELFAEAALGLRRQYAGGDGGNHEIYASLYLVATKWFVQEGMRSTAFTSFRKMIAARPQYLATLSGANACMQLFFGKRVIIFLSALTAAARRKLTRRISTHGT